MRSTFGQLLLVGLTACGISTQAATVRWTAPDPQDRVFRAVTLVLADSGYVIEDADRNTGLLRASRQKSSSAETILTGAAEVWEITAIIVPTDSGTAVTLQPAYVQLRPYGHRYQGGVTTGHQRHVAGLRAAIEQQLAGKLPS